MSLEIRIEPDERMSFPRVSGDEPAIDAEVDELMEFSPRERG